MMRQRFAEAIKMKTSKEEELSIAEIAEIQREAWAQTYRYVFAHSPFYQKHFRQAGLSARDALPLSQLNAIPPTSKTMVSENPAAFRCVPESKVVDVVTTSGSTGQPLVWMLTEADLQRLALNEELSFRCAGFSAEDKVILAVAMDRCFIAGMAYFLGLRRVGCSVLRVGPSAPLMHLDLLQRVGATGIVGVPSFLCLLAEKAAEAGIELPALGVRKAVCIGEPVRHPDLTLNRAGETIERRWGAKVFSTYGVTELAASLCECEAGAGGHLHPELLFLEALDEEGRPVAEGEVGELTATTFGVEGMPLVRYRTGDYAAIDAAPCRCGRRTLRIGPIVGRKHHKLKVKGTSLFPSTLKAVLDSVAEVSAYVIIARRENQVSDSVEVRVACAADSAGVVRRLRERFQGEAKVMPEIRIGSAAEIEALQMPEGARKRRHFVDLRE
jgi:phenylacetate-CoA ligase